MTGQTGTVAHDDVITHDTVMSYMGTCLEKAVTADARFFPFTSCSADRYKFTENRPVSDDQIALFTMIFQILWF